jgi:hypothetical protein
MGILTVPEEIVLLEEVVQITTLNHKITTLNTALLDRIALEPKVLRQEEKVLRQEATNHRRLDHQVAEAQVEVHHLVVVEEAVVEGNI